MKTVLVLFAAIVAVNAICGDLKPGEVRQPEGHCYADECIGEEILRKVCVEPTDPKGDCELVPENPELRFPHCCSHYLCE